MKLNAFISIRKYVDRRCNSKVFYCIIQITKLNICYNLRYQFLPLGAPTKLNLSEHIINWLMVKEMRI